MTKRTCNIDGCPKPHKSRGWCSSHYDAAKRSGRLHEQPRTKALSTDSLDARLRNAGWTVTPSGCWEWNGTRHVAGYGMIQTGKGKPTTASRAAYEAWVKVPTPGSFICHTCDNPPCINPAHLFEGSPQDNVTDMVTKKRVANGERRKNKLTDAQVAEIRSRYVPWKVTQRELAEEYGVSQQTIGAIVTFESRRYETYRSIA